MVKRLGLSGLITLGSAFLMVAAGIALCRFSGDRAATGPPQAAQGSASDRLPDRARRGGEVAKPSVTPEAERPTAVGPGATPAGKTAAQSPASAVAPVRPQARGESDREVRPRQPLPPFPAPDFPPAGVAEASTGPAPDVLWLSGVIQGNPKLALLRRGETRYLVKEGGTFESYRVVKIGSNSVTIQRGSRKRTLRVGQY
jgi:hypothetical protein